MWSRAARASNNWLTQQPPREQGTTLGSPADHVRRTGGTDAGSTTTARCRMAMASLRRERHAGVLTLDDAAVLPQWNHPCHHGYGPEGHLMTRSLVDAERFERSNS